MTEKDRQNLFGGKKCIAAFFAKRKLMKELDALIKEADELLVKYPEVEFLNVLETAYIQNSSIANAEKIWSEKVDNVLRETFRQVSDVERAFGSTRWTQAISQYANTRCTLVKKREIIVALRDEIKAL
jgi:hypothetical protein